MAGYQLTIKNAEDTIELTTKEGNGKADIVTASFKMNTLNDDTRNRADSVRGEIIITGNITEENKDKTKKLAKWSIDSDKKTLYRDVELLIYDSQNCTGTVLRRYQLDEMFVIDYSEEFRDDSDEDFNDNGKYTLFIAQKEGRKKIEVFSS